MSRPRVVTYLPGAGSTATRKRTMKGMFAPLLLSILLTSYTVSHASDAPPPDTAVPGPRTPIDVDHTASIVGIQIGTRLAAFIFISKDGKHQNIGADECAQSVK